MFTGIIQAAGKIAEQKEQGGDRCLAIACPELSLTDVALGDSIAVNGVCLTVTRKTTDRFWADVCCETLRLTTLAHTAVGDPVNLEKCLTLQTPLGGHWISGHVDGTATLVDRYQAGRGECLTFRVPEALARFIAYKGSVCLNGISLTVATVQDNQLTVALIPHTLSHTNLQHVPIGGLVNLEVDILARYLERLFTHRQHSEQSAGISRAFLAEHGFALEGNQS